MVSGPWLIRARHRLFLARWLVVVQFGLEKPGFFEKPGFWVAKPYHYQMAAGPTEFAGKNASGCGYLRYL